MISARRKIFIFLILQLLFSGLLFAQSTEPDLETINQNRIGLNSKGMLMLGGWAVSNMIVGGIGMAKTNGTTKYFHQMNAVWNTVNLTIAGFGYYGLRNQDVGMSLSETISEFHSFEKILLFNAGLDVGYMALGAFLVGARVEKREQSPDRLRAIPHFTGWLSSSHLIRFSIF
ncbi:MAG: hypothetical protein U5K72_05600 [Balneolaceae bacterium]|nr:hypothetical protein [Balneolaceae bacterium]